MSIKTVSVFESVCSEELEDEVQRGGVKRLLYVLETTSGENKRQISWYGVIMIRGYG